MATPSETTPITVGTAGHIDHGKTRLVEQLTGMRADRPYERERGMTIDIGYAEMTTPGGRRIGFVDLPGHERFIRNMVAGATGIDLALLVVAADDGVMPQTREHMEILGLLGIRRGLVVLNKVDLVDDEMKELALEELSEFLAETSLKDAPIIACSSETGEGVEDVAEALLELVRGITASDDPGSFFLGIQRTFAAQGFGCIVTGVPSAGHVTPGEELELLPRGDKVRVRGIQVYHEAAEYARAGHRTALNLSGVSHSDAERGMVVAKPGAYRPVRHTAVELTVVGTAKRPIRHAAGVRFLTGTLEEMAKVYLFEGKELRPGEKAVVEIRTRAPVVVRAGAPFIVRSDNAKETLGGGIVVRSLDDAIARKDTAARTRLEERADCLREGSQRLVLYELALADSPLNPAQLARRCELDKATVTAQLEALRGGAVEELAGGLWVHSGEVASGTEAVRTALADMHREQPLVAALPLASVRDRAGVSEAVMATILERLGDEVVVEARTLRAATHEVRVDRQLETASTQLLACLRGARFAPPLREQLAEAAELDGGDLAAALTFLTDQGNIREVAPGLLYGTEQLDEGLRLLKAVAERCGSFEPGDAKAALGGISRKWLIPLLEFYDRLGATRRDGNRRRLTPKGQAMAENGIREA